MKLISFILIILFSLTSLSSSTKNIKQYDFNDFCITFDNIFNLKDKEYCVFFYLKYCLSCKYLNEQINLKKVYLKRKIYYVDLESLPLANLKYQKNNLYVNNYVDIYLNSSPTILKIEHKMVVKQIDNFNGIIEEFELH